MEFSELRRDIVSGDWIVIAPKRGARPHKIKKTKRVRQSKKDCVFEDKSKTPKEILEFANGHGWTLRIVENKFPAFTHSNVCATEVKHGPYLTMRGVGHHDVVITRDHDKDFSDLTPRRATEVLHAFKERYRSLAEDKCLAYTSIFHNYGPRAGASIYHPHYQIIAVPVVPPDVRHSLKGADWYYKKKKKCVHCTMIAWEGKEKKRVIVENKRAIAFVPFVSRESFEIRVFPKTHSAYFENASDAVLADVVSVLQASLKMLKKKLGDPDYNFFLHTAPMKDKKKHKNYHWHIEVVPKMGIDAGFELGTGVEINAVDPDDAARILKAKK